MTWASNFFFGIKNGSTCRVSRHLLFTPTRRVSRLKRAEMFAMSFRCISCGEPSKELYKDYDKGIIKISHCNHCGQVVDKYIEYDPVIIFLDALLLKKEAFRHVLFNASLQAHWKLTLILLICDAYAKLVFPKTMVQSNRIEADRVLDLALQFDLYYNYFTSFIELAACLLGLLCSVYVMQLIMKHFHYRPVRMNDVIRGYLLSNFGKIFVIPAILWGSGSGDIYMILSQLFVIVCNFQAMRVVMSDWHIIIPVCCLFFGYLTQAVAVQLAYIPFVT